MQTTVSSQPNRLRTASSSKGPPAKAGGIRVEHALGVLATPDELYRFWRNFENLPRFMRYLESVDHLGGDRYRWVARGPLDVRVEWDAEITNESPDEFIAWRSLPGSAVNTEGTVRFEPATGKRGSIVRIILRYEPLAGAVSDVIARLFGRSPEQEIREDLRRFKRFIEAGEIPTTCGQPSGRGQERWQQTAPMVLLDRLASGLGWFSIGLGLTELSAPKTLGRLIGISERHQGLLRLLGLREAITGVGILTGRPRPTGWLWGRVAGDAIDLALLADALRTHGTDKGRNVLATAAVLGVTAADLYCSLQFSSHTRCETGS
jgi:uncharacterized membrane protein